MLIDFSYSIKSILQQKSALNQTTYASVSLFCLSFLKLLTLTVYSYNKA